MHPTVLDATGYTLLLSSFIALVILLWKGCKRKKKSSFYVLSASDIFSGALTAILLLVSHIEAGMRLSYNWQNNTGSDMPNHAWSTEDNYRFPFLQIREVFNEIDRNVTLTCGMKDIFTQYGMLLAALTNAFISSLTFTVQCNLNAAYMKKRCANVMNSLRNAQLQPKNVEVKCQESEIFKSEQELASLRRDNINVKTRSNVIQRIMKVSSFRTLKGEKSTSFLVTSHWLVPFLVIGILYFAEYSDMNNIRHTEDIECILESNFPMNTFDMLSDTDDNLNIIGSVAYITPSEHAYFFNEKLSNESKPNSVEVDEVVSKVQTIVRTALSYKDNSTKDIGIINFLSTPGSQNLTKYILTNDIIRYIKDITNINSVVRELNDTERDINVHNSSTNNNIYLNKDSEVPFFYDILKNTSEELDAITSGNQNNVSQESIGNEDESYQEDAQIHFASTEESTTQMTINTTFVRNATFVPNNQIYDVIMKRIQAASVHSAAKNHYNRSVSQLKDGNQLKINNLKNYITKRKPNSIKNFFSDKNKNRYVNADTKQSSSLHLTNECLISTKFLKQHLFVLSFMIYFLPILFSCILQMRGRHICKNTLETLRTKVNLPSTSSKKIHRQDSVEDSSTTQELRNNQSGTDIEAIKKNHERENESLALEINCMVRIFNTIKLSLILCVVLWTPIFLGTLLKVYSCTHVPQWLTDTTFLSACFFGIVRNALNINIIRIQEICSKAGMKENKIRPVE